MASVPWLPRLEGKVPKNSLTSSRLRSCRLWKSRKKDCVSCKSNGGVPHKHCGCLPLKRRGVDL